MVEVQAFEWLPEEIEELSDIQRTICDLCHQKTSDTEIMNTLHLAAKENIFTAIRFTMRGCLWVPTVTTGGQYSYLGDMDAKKVVEMLTERGSDLNCCRTIECMEFANERHSIRYRRAKEIFEYIKRSDTKGKRFDQLLTLMSDCAPPTCWLTEFCKKHNIRIKDATLLEEARRRCCNRLVVLRFYEKNKPFINGIDKRLLWNADEASACSTRKYKVLLGEGTKFPISPFDKHTEKISTMYSINANGDKMDPFIILPDLEKVPDDLVDFDDCVFCTQKNGWMTSKLFYVFCVYFTANIQALRIKHQEISLKTAVLLVDNHASRLNSKAVEFLALHNIRLITFPAHCTHVLQPFDVAVAASVKGRMKKVKISTRLQNHLNSLRTKKARARYTIVYSIIEAWGQVTRDTIRNGFEAAGILPFKPEKGLMHKFTNANPPNGLAATTESITSNQELTSVANRIKLANKQYPQDIQTVQQIPPVEYAYVYPYATNKDSMEDGFLLTSLPSLCIEVLPKTWLMVLAKN